MAMDRILQIKVKEIKYVLQHKLDTTSQANQIKEKDIRITKVKRGKKL